MRSLWFVFGLVSCAPSLAGRISTASGDVIHAQDARVNVSGLDDEISFVLNVDHNGEFNADKKLPSGDYLVEALVPGYKIESKRVTIGEESRTPIELKLTPLEKTQPRSTSANLDAPEGRGAGGASLTPPTF